jgi:pilus assembly protein Flp/PilA
VTYFPPQRREKRVEGTMRSLSGLIRDTRGATAVEYGLILAMIFLAMVGALSTVAGTTIQMWNNVSTVVRANS